MQAGQGGRVRTLLITGFVAASVVAAEPRKIPLASSDELTPMAVRVEPATYRGRAAMRVVEPKINSGGGIAVLNGVTFGSGVIEAQVAGMPAGGAVEGSRGFIGIAFRILRDPFRYEAFYLRPTNGRADDQLRRNHATQYISEPAFPWERLRKETPGVYESYVDLEPGTWTRVKIVVNGNKAQLYVHDAPQPVLVVNELKLGDVSGGVALWIGQGTEAYFSGFQITPASQ